MLRMNKDDFEEALRNTLLWETALYEALVPALEARRRFEEGRNEEKFPGGNARMLLSTALHVAGVLVGPEAMRQAYESDPDDSAPREDHLEKLAWRLTLISDIYSGAETYMAPSSISALTDEIRAIAHHDKASLLAEFPSQQRRPVNAWRLAKTQLSALEWEIHLRGKGKTPAEAQAMVCAAYGPALAWTTVARWKKPIVRELGQEIYDRAIVAAKRGASFYSGAGRYSVSPGEALARDGERYRVERRKSLEVVR